MPQYMFLIYSPADAPPPGDPAQQRERWQDYTTRLEQAGVVVTHGRLHDAHSATTVRASRGETLISDGPFAEAKEYLAGFYLVDCPDLDAALALVGGMPAVESGTVEVRPLMFPVGTPPAEMQAPAPV